MNKYDVVIVGAGPGGIFTALNLIEKNPKLKILMLEKGKPVHQRSHTGIDLTQGFGGCGSWSDGKLCMSLDAGYGGNLQEYIELKKFSELMQSVDDTHMRFSDNKDLKVFGDDLAVVAPIKSRAAVYDMTLLTARIRHLGTENNEQIMKNMYEFLKDKVEIRFGAEVTGFSKTEDRFDKTINLETYQYDKPAEFIPGGFKVEFKKDGNFDIVKSKYLVLMPGRSGNRWFGQIAKEHGLKIRNNQIDIGVRVEFPEFIGREIGNALYEPKLVITDPKTGLKSRTFCWNNGGHVVAESVTDNGKDYLTVNGHSFNSSDMKTPNSNFALLVSAEFTEPFNDPIAYGRAVAQTCNLIGGGKAIVQRLKDAKLGRRSTVKRMQELYMKPTLADAVPGDLSFAFPAKQWNAIMRSLEILDKLFPGMNGEETILYGPEIKWYSARAELSNKLESSISNLFCGGDGCGISRGIVQAAMCGLVVSEEIAEREK
jgi:uncharacterized FAD-dependent dehydrogenase